jgi:hypothetical protein
MNKITDWENGPVLSRPALLQFALCVGRGLVRCRDRVCILPDGHNQGSTRQWQTQHRKS